MFYVSYVHNDAYQATFVDLDTAEPRPAQIYSKLPPKSIVLHCQPDTWAASGLVELTVLFLRNRSLLRVQVPVQARKPLRATLQRLGQRFRQPYVVLFASAPCPAPLPPLAAAYDSSTCVASSGASVAGSTGAGGTGAGSV